MHHSGGVWDRIAEAEEGGHNVSLRIEYADAAARARYVTTLRLYRAEDTTWRIVRQDTSQKYG